MAGSAAAGGSSLLSALLGSTSAAANATVAPSPPREASADDEEPADYVCPITHEIMTDPVVTADGQSYERYAIEQWLRHSTLSPLTNEPLSHLALTPNMALRRLIREWIEQREAAGLARRVPSHGSHHRRGRRGGAGIVDPGGGEGKGAKGRGGSGSRTGRGRSTSGAGRP